MSRNRKGFLEFLQTPVICGMIGAMLWQGIEDGSGGLLATGVAIALFFIIESISDAAKAIVKALQEQQLPADPPVK